MTTDLMNALVLVHDAQCAIATIRDLHDSIFYSDELSTAARRKAMQILFHAAMHIECRPTRHFGSSVPLAGVGRYMPRKVAL